MIANVAIIGTGLIGGSFGLALRAAGFAGRIAGVSSPRAIDAALACGAIDAGAPLAEAVPQADLVFLSQPIGRILDTIRHLDPLVRPEALVTDAGSTKCEIVEVARQHLRRCQFLGGHPMAGKEKRGAEAGDAELFRGRTWVLTPDMAEELDTEAAREFTGWLERIGARVTVLDSDEHDRVVSLTSHLPQLASTALGATLARRLDIEKYGRIAGPGLMDTTRLAMSSHEIWRDILATNSGEVELALDAYISELRDLRAFLVDRRMEQEFEVAADFASKIRRKEEEDA